MQQQAVADLIHEYGGDVRTVPGRPRYHLDRCRHVSGHDAETMDVRDALEDGYTPCGVCRPDAVLIADAEALAVTQAAAQQAPPSVPLPRQASVATAGSTLACVPAAVEAVAGNAPSTKSRATDAPLSQRPIVAVMTDGRPIVQPRQVPPGTAQPLGELPDGSPVWAVPNGFSRPGAAVPYGLTSDGSPVWAVPVRPSRRPVWQKKRVLVPAAVVALLILVGIAGQDDQPTEARNTAAGSESSAGAAAPADPAQAAAEQAAAEQAAAEEAAADQAAAEKAAADKAAAEKAAADQAAAEKAAADQAAAEKAAAEAAKGTPSQQNAYDTALDYLDYSAFSRAGLIGQLSSEYGSQFPAADAEFAVARLEREGNVDWNAEAAEAAKDYLDYSSFSRQGLLDQLTSEHGSQFTREQAEYGVSQAGL